MGSNRLLVKITHENLPQMKDRYPFIYLERGRLEIDDSSVKWIDSEGHVVRLPIATIACILFGPGTSITHEAVKVLASSNTTACWVGEDSLLFYACGHSPTSDSRNMRKQMELASNPEKRLAVARRMFTDRFPDDDVSERSIKDLMGMEGLRVRKLYEEMAGKYNVGWKGRRYEPGHFEMSDTTNKIMTAANTALYALILSVVFSMGYSPYVGFVHSGSPLPFIYDMADLYKAEMSIEFAFSMTLKMAGVYDRLLLLDSFRSLAIEKDLLARIPVDLTRMLEDGK